jgi:uncharacterized protein (TIGR02466 family)
VAVITTDIMNQPYNVFPLFSTPVLVYEIDIEEKERAFLLSHYPEKTISNRGNSTSTDNNILKRVEVQELNEKLALLVNEAFSFIHNPLHDVGLYITQSWLNFTSKDQYHHVHTHPNSIYSAVLYLKAEEGDSITFHNPFPRNYYNVPSVHYNHFNSTEWNLTIKENLLIFFPSTLPHSVPTVGHDNLRVSLSFNTFFKGQLGAPTDLNYLKV